jgi:hypothetical protein
MFKHRVRKFILAPLNNLLFINTDGAAVVQKKAT